MIVLYGLIRTTTGQSSVLMDVELVVHVFYDPLDKRVKDTQSCDYDPGLDLWNGSCGIIGGLYLLNGQLIRGSSRSNRFYDLCS